MAAEKPNCKNPLHIKIQNSAYTNFTSSQKNKKINRNVAYRDGDACAKL